MAEYMIRMADERGHIREQVELGNSEGEVRERFSQQGFLVYWVKPKGLLLDRHSAATPPQNQARPVRHLQSAVCDADPRRACRSSSRWSC